MKILVFDTEATARDGQICQLAYLMIDGETISGKNMFFAVDSMSADAQQVHGLSPETLRTLSGGQKFADRATEILADFADADLLVGHNISADVRMMQLEFSRLQMPWPETPTFCTMNRFTPILKLKRLRGPGSPKPPKLGELCDFYGITPDSIAAFCATHFTHSGSAHDARYDAAATYLSLRAATEKGDATIE